jgi:hypothetical protein
MRFKLLAATLMAAPFMVFGANAGATEFHATFSGFEEVGGLNAETGAILSTGAATLDLNLDRQARTITFKLTFSGLSNVLQSHIHFGKRHVPGGIMVFFCAANPTVPATAPPGTQACPTSAGTVTGMISGGNVLAVPGQNVPAGDFDALVAALDSDTAYGNIHTVNFKGGEIRGQIRRADDDDKH